MNKWTFAWQQAKKFNQFYWSANTKYQIHSPFVSQWVSEVLEDNRHYYAFDTLNKLRENLKADERIIEVTDFGAGSQTLQQRQRKVRQIANTSVRSHHWAAFLFRQILFSKPRYMLEIGTSLGLTTLYQHFAAPDALFHTIEGCPNIAAIAKQNIQASTPKAANIHTHIGNFDTVLPRLLEEIPHLDYVLIDGNHREEPTLRYFEWCLPKVQNDTVFIFDDIHWSDGMEKAWKAIQEHSSVRLSIDAYFFGLVFFRKEQKEKEHFRLMPYHWNPLKII
jgi:predicted O-methyltransferase YrrM